MRLIDADALKKYFEDNSNDIQGNEWFVINIIEAITNAPTIQREGWVSVPIEPSNEMIYAGAETLASFSPMDAICIYKAMIQAAPTDTE